MPQNFHFFPKSKFFINQKTPDPKKNFFENYSDHLDFLALKLDQKCYQLQQIDNTADAIRFIGKEALKRLTMFEQLRDAHDYFDEVLGVTVLPPLSIIISVAALGQALWEAAHHLAIKSGFTRNDYTDHLDNAGGFLLISITSILFSIACFLKSAISLATRPLVTAIHGYAEQDEDRFHNENSVIGRALFG